MLIVTSIINLKSRALTKIFRSKGTSSLWKHEVKTPLRVIYLEIQYIEKIIFNSNNMKNASEDHTEERKMQGHFFFK